MPAFLFGLFFLSFSTFHPSLHQKHIMLPFFFFNAIIFPFLRVRIAFISFDGELQPALLLSYSFPPPPPLKIFELTVSPPP